MRKWNMTMRFWQDVEFEVKAENYDEAVAKAFELTREFPEDSFEYDECALHDYEELPGDYEFADGYFDDPEEEEFEPG